MHLQRIFLLLTALVCAVLIFCPWATLPILGTISGTGNGAGIFSLFCVGATLVLSLISGNINSLLPPSTRLAISILSVSILIAVIYYYSTVTDAADKIINASSIPVFGVPIGTVYNKNDFTVEIGLYLTGATAIVIMLFAFVFSQSNEIPTTENSYGFILEGKKEELTNLDSEINNGEIIGKLKELLALRDNNVITEEMYEQEKSTLVSRYKIKKSNDDTQSIKIEDSQSKDEGHYTPYITSDKQDSKARFPIVIIIVLGLGLLIAGILFFATQNEAKLVSSEDQKDSMKIKDLNNLSNSSSLISKKNLKAAKDIIDKKYDSKNGRLSTLIKTVDNKLVEFKGEYPESYSAIYNLLKDESGKLILFEEIPYSESGDSHIGIVHYFDSEGKTFATELLNNYFESQGIIYSTKVTYYDDRFNKVAEDISIKDKKKRSLIGKVAFYFPSNPELEPNSEKCISSIQKLQVVEFTGEIPKVEDYFIPSENHNVAVYDKPNNQGVSMEKKITFKKTTNGYDIMDEGLLNDNTSYIHIYSIVCDNNEVRITRDITTNVLATNKHRTFTPSILFLRIPRKGNIVNWSYPDPKGINIKNTDIIQCTAFWTTQSVKLNGQLAEVPVLKVVKTTPAMEGESIEYYREGEGLVSEEFISAKGKRSQQFQLSSLSNEDVDNIDFFDF